MCSLIRILTRARARPIPQKDFETAHRVNKSHGRIEQRTLTVSSQLNDFLDWPYQEQVFKLERRFIFTKTDEVEQQVVYGITSLTREEISPHILLQMIRSYWGIENGLHFAERSSSAKTRLG